MTVKELKRQNLPGQRGWELGSNGHIATNLDQRKWKTRHTDFKVQDPWKAQDVETPSYSESKVHVGMETGLLIESLYK